MTGSTTNSLQPAAWWRVLCFPIERVALSGDLDTTTSGTAQRQLMTWADAGITDIIDVRREWSDASLVARLAPWMRYHWIGTHDSGHAQSDDWFDEGVEAALDALADPDRKVVVHCHMGVNRAPSLAFGVLLALGHHPVEALDLIRASRPIAAVLYAQDALRWWHRRSAAPMDTRAAERSAVAEWLDRNAADVGWVISRIRAAEGAA